MENWMNSFGPAYSQRPHSASPPAHRRSAHSARAARCSASAPTMVTVRGARAAAYRSTAARCPNSGGLRMSNERATRRAKRGKQDLTEMFQHQGGGGGAPGWWRSTMTAAHSARRRVPMCPEDAGGSEGEGWPANQWLFARDGGAEKERL
jgi:hypothetical protein